MIDLQKFCSESDLRPNIQKPWRRGGFTWATDGRILIRVSSDDFPSGENGAAPNATTVGAFDHDSLKTEWLPMPQIPEPVFVECRKCKGIGKNSKCRNCQGEGRCECDCGHDYDCGECDGTGYQGFGEKCDNCDNGKIEETQQVGIGEAVVNALYLHKIATLPNPEFARPSEWDKPIAFRFNGGVGYLMPMRKTESSIPVPDQMLTQSRRQQLQRLKDKGLVKKYLITIRSDARGKWSFSYHGHISFWQGFLVTLAGWTIEEVE